MPRQIEGSRAVAEAVALCRPEVIGAYPISPQTHIVEAVYNASGLGLPIVMTVANRAIGSPINIWNDHSDSMSQRDSGWIQLFVESNQEAVDVHLQAYRIAEEVALPVMVCMDGFVLTHAYEEVDIPDQARVDAFLPPFKP